MASVIVFFCLLLRTTPNLTKIVPMAGRKRGVNVLNEKLQEEFGFIKKKARAIAMFTAIFVIWNSALLTVENQIL
jgi:hypothetical protein